MVSKQTTPAAPPAEPRVSDDDWRMLADGTKRALFDKMLAGEAAHIRQAMENGAKANRERERADKAEATIASQAEALAAKEVEIERLKDFEPDYHRSRAELMQHFEARIAAEAALKAAREALEHLADDFHNDWSKDTRHETIRAVEKFAKERLAALSPPTKEPGKAGGEVG